MAPKDQDQVFSDYESDNWFDRNRQAGERFDPDADPAMRMMAVCGLKPENVLEVGACFGYRVAAIRERYGASGVCVEPSGQAIEHGKRTFPHLRFAQGTAADIPLDGPFDLIIVNYVFHWVGRTNLLRAVAEVDRLLAPRGYLLIGDFDPAFRTRVPYHHLSDEEVFTHKQNYAAVFEASGGYQQVCMLSGRYATSPEEPPVAQQDRSAVRLLQKDWSAGYVEQDYRPDEPSKEPA